MRPVIFLLLTILGACATQSPVSNAYFARFPNFPANLMQAVRDVCSEPAQTYARLSPTMSQCRQFLDPELTAAAILQYNGTPEDLPQLVILFSILPEAQSYLFKTEIFLNVPQKSGGEVHVLFPSAALDRRLASVYRAAGGVPVTMAP